MAATGVARARPSGSSGGRRREEGGSGRGGRSRGGLGTEGNGGLEGFWIRDFKRLGIFLAGKGGREMGGGKFGGGGETKKQAEAATVKF